MAGLSRGRQAAWFVGLYVAGVAVVLAVAGVIRAFLAP
jgi:hypothetical protein